jgi:RNA polymerase sigma factor (sigma-70 family)
MPINETVTAPDRAQLPGGARTPWTVDELVPGGLGRARQAFCFPHEKIRPLSPFTERKCAQLAKEGNKDAVEILIGANVRYVFWVARRIRETGEIGDLVAAGIGALLHALRSYDPDSGCRLVAFADRGIYLAILNAINGERLVALPQYVSELGARIRKFESAFFAREGRQPTEEELADRFDLAGEDLSIARKERVVSFDMPIGEDGKTLFHELYSDPDQAPADRRAEVRLKWASFMRALLRFSTENQKIIEWSFGILGKDKLPVQKIATMLHMSRDRVVKRRDSILRIISGLVQEGKEPSRAALLEAGVLTTQGGPECINKPGGTPRQPADETPAVGSRRRENHNKGGRL